MIRGLEQLFHEEQLRELALFREEKRQLRGDLINAYKYLKARRQEDGDRLFSVVPSNRTRIYKHKLEHRKFHLNIRRSIGMDLATGSSQHSLHWNLDG
ncbi:hypothetical protein BTVI_112872 [Pitangus sulphuratus]|nr:hypothetical protein BTVI_112872 [Pitangus sulphuratus]